MADEVVLVLQLALHRVWPYLVPGTERLDALAGVGAMILLFCGTDVPGADDNAPLFMSCHEELRLKLLLMQTSELQCMHGLQ